jgi:twinkle protein
MIIPHAEIQREVLEIYRSGGLKRGSLTGWPSVDKLYTVAPAQWTLVTGVPHAGKSEWVDALMVNLAKREPWRFYIYSPENWPLAIHHAKIIEKYIGKPFNPGPTPRADEEDVDAAEHWMSDKFFFVKPDLAQVGAIILDAYDEYRQTKQIERLGVIVDPWNHLEHNRPSGMSETEYVSMSLSEVIKGVRITNMHLWLVAHPAKLQRDRDGKFPVPTPRDVSGSAHWWAKADNCITIHRDQTEDNQKVEIHVQKIRFKHCGHVGMTTLLYDRVTGRYNEQLLSSKSYAGKGQ